MQVDVFDIIENLRNTPGMNDKRAILRENKDNELFKKVLTYTFDPRLTYGIKKIPAYETNDFNVISLEEALSALDVLIQRKVTGNKATEHLRAVLSSLSKKDAKVIEQVIAKDFKAGFGVSMINKEMKPFQIYEVPYMGAISFDEKKVQDLFKEHEYGISEVKMDGRYLNVKVQGENVQLESRGGKPNPLMGALEKEAIEFRNYVGKDVVINGELMFSGESNRYLANGIIASYVSIAQKEYDGKDIKKEVKKFQEEYGITIDEAKERITLVVWDFVYIDEFENKFSNRYRKDRLKDLEKVINNTETFKLIEYKVVHNYSEAMDHFHKMIQRGEEGTILKGSEGLWEDKKPNYQIKMKLEMNLDLRITGFNYGTPGTKYEDFITSLNVESEDGLLKTSPGGIKEKDMKYITEHKEELLGKVVEIKCSGLSQNSEGDWACLHPVFVRIRDDKDTCDDLETCQKIENMKKGLQ